MAEAEYIAVGSCYAEVLYMKHQLEDFGLYFDHIPINCDNTSAICLSKNPIHTLRLNISKFGITLFKTMFKKGT